MFKLPLETSLLYGWITSAVGVVASLICALYIDKVGRKRWYAVAFLLATVPLVILTALGATTATQVVILAPIAYAILQTIAFSLYLYSAELYPTRLRAIGTGFGSAWLRAGSSIGPVLVGFIVAGVGIRYVFLAFAVDRPHRRPRHHPVRDRDQGQGPRRTLALTTIHSQPAAGLCPRPVLAGHEFRQRGWWSRLAEPHAGVRPGDQGRDTPPATASTSPAPLSSSIVATAFRMTATGSNDQNPLRVHLSPRVLFAPVSRTHPNPPGYGHTSLHFGDSASEADQGAMPLS